MQDRRALQKVDLLVVVGGDDLVFLLKVELEQLLVLCWPLWLGDARDGINEPRGQ